MLTNQVVPEITQQSSSTKKVAALSLVLISAVCNMFLYYYVLREFKRDTGDDSAFLTGVVNAGYASLFSPVLQYLALETGNALNTLNELSIEQIKHAYDGTMKERLFKIFPVSCINALVLFGVFLTTLDGYNELSLSRGWLGLFSTLSLVDVFLTFATDCRYYFEFLATSVWFRLTKKQLKGSETIPEENDAHVSFTGQKTPQFSYWRYIYYCGKDPNRTIAKIGMPNVKNRIDRSKIEGAPEAFWPRLWFVLMDTRFYEFAKVVSDQALFVWYSVFAFGFLNAVIELLFMYTVCGSIANFFNFNAKNVGYMILTAGCMAGKFLHTLALDGRVSSDFAAEATDMYLSDFKQSSSWPVKMIIFLNGLAGAYLNFLMGYISVQDVFELDSGSLKSISFGCGAGFIKLLYNLLVETVILYYFLMKVFPKGAGPEKLTAINHEAGDENSGLMTTRPDYGATRPGP